MRTVGSAHMNNEFITVQTEVKWQTPIIKSICKQILQYDEQYIFQDLTLICTVPMALCLKLGLHTTG